MGIGMVKPAATDSGVNDRALIVYFFELCVKASLAASFLFSVGARTQIRVVLWTFLNGSKPKDKVA